MGSLKLSAELYNLRKKKLDDIKGCIILINKCIKDPDTYEVAQIRKDILNNIAGIISEYGQLIGRVIDEPTHFDFIDNYTNCDKDNSELKWISSEEGLRKYKYGDLVIAYQPGYPLMIADWKTGDGYRDVRTGESINPTRIAFINLPDKK